MRRSKETPQVVSKYNAVESQVLALAEPFAEAAQCHAAGAGRDRAVLAEHTRQIVTRVHV